MAKLDIPTLQCDRCKIATTDKMEMMGFQELRHSDIGGEQKWDLCKECWNKFLTIFIGSDVTYAELYDGVKAGLIDNKELLDRHIPTNNNSLDQISFITTESILKVLSRERV